MAKTLAEAVTEARKFIRMHKDRNVEILDHGPNFKPAYLRYNFRFPSKRGSAQRIDIIKVR